LFPGAWCLTLAFFSSDSFVIILVIVLRCQLVLLSFSLLLTTWLIVCVVSIITSQVIVLQWRLHGCMKARGYTGRLYHKQLVRLDLNNTALSASTMRRDGCDAIEVRGSSMGRRLRDSSALSLSRQMTPAVIIQTMMVLAWVKPNHFRHARLVAPASALLRASVYLFTRTAAD